MSELLAYNPDKPVSLPGVRCAYCGCVIGGRATTSDHVVARRFVPEGTLGSAFHLQVKSCRPCNDRKAALEDDISVITMLPDTAGDYARDDERLLRTVARKAKGAISPATRRLAAHSYNKIDARLPLAGGASLTYSGLAMPTLEDQRVARLAYYHTQGFVFFRSFDPDRGHGRWLQPDRFHMLGQVTNGDWGNPRLRRFTAQVRAWEPNCIVNMADGYFRHAMFQKPGSELWAWALEWNGRLRVFGLYGEAGERQAFSRALPPVQADFGAGDTTNGFFLRVDTPLADDEDDPLFATPDGFEDQTFAGPHWRRGP
ncbi:MAG TPA: HNH endonuclease signature motif containing protein [Allosphingosinicella sp.]|jgi:hypothetical protein